MLLINVMASVLSKKKPLEYFHYVIKKEDLQRMGYDFAEVILVFLLQFILIGIKFQPPTILLFWCCHFLSFFSKSGSSLQKFFMWFALPLVVLIDFQKVNSIPGTWSSRSSTSPPVQGSYPSTLFTNTWICSSWGKVLFLH